MTPEENANDAFRAGITIGMVKQLILHVDGLRLHPEASRDVLRRVADVLARVVAADDPGPELDRIFKEQYEATMPRVFQCPVCGKVSHNTEDLRHGYCGNCHCFTAPPREL